MEVLVIFWKGVYLYSPYLERWWLRLFSTYWDHPLIGYCVLIKQDSALDVPAVNRSSCWDKLSMSATHFGVQEGFQAYARLEICNSYFCVILLWLSFHLLCFECVFVQMLHTYIKTSKNCYKNKSFHQALKIQVLYQIAPCLVRFVCSVYCFLL